MNEYAPGLLGDLDTLLLTVLVGLGAYFVGVRLARRDRVRAQDELERVRALVREQGRTISRMRSEQGSGANLGLILPMMVRELNRSDLNARRVPRLIVQLAEAVFQPSQVLLYVTRPSTPKSDLHLSGHHGLVDVPDALVRIPYEVGRIGWVASHRVEMFREDWPRTERIEGSSIPSNHPAADLEMIAPLIHYSAEGERVLGVICVGAPGLRNRDEKMMLQLVANLGALALVNASNMSALRDKAHYDGLTGLANKGHFVYRVASLLLRAAREAHPLAIFIFDIDHFKNFNDTNGHMAGDDLLRRLAAVLRDNLRPHDVSCRYGGEEFIVAMPDTGAEDAMSVAERIRQAIESTPFRHRERQPGGKLTVSGGLAVFPRDGGNLDELIEHADQALYAAKRAGRNRVRAYRVEEFGPGHALDPLAAGHAPIESDRTEGDEVGYEVDARGEEFPSYEPEESDYEPLGS